MPGKTPGRDGEPPSREEIDACRRCELWKPATHGVPGEGAIAARVMLVGEQPGNDEDLAGRPFVGPAGLLLRKLLEEAGLAIEVGQLLWIVESIPGDKHRHVMNLIFSAEAHTDNLFPGPDKVLRDVAWMPIEQIESLALFPDTKTEILEFLRSGSSAKTLLGKRWRNPDAG